MRFGGYPSKIRLKERLKFLMIKKEVLIMEVSRYSLIVIFISLFLTAGCRDSSGPDPAPEIASINPLEGSPGTAVTIRGSGFSDRTTENTIEFNGTSAVVRFATPERLETTVPEEATSGPLEISVAGQSVIGPVFTVDLRGIFEGDYVSENYEIHLFETDGSNVINDTTFTVDGGSEVDIRLPEDSINEIEVSMEDFVEDGINAAEIAVGGDGILIVDFENVPIGEVSDNSFELNRIDFNVEDGVDTVPGRITAEGVLEGERITLSFEYFFQAGFNRATFSGEVELKKQQPSKIE